MFCSKCGNKLEDGVNVCPNCGHANNDKIINAVSAIQSFKAKGTKGLTVLLKICCAVKIIMYTACGGVIGEFMGYLTRGDDYVSAGVTIGFLLSIFSIIKDLIFANIAENVNIVANNTSENNKR